LIARYAEEKRKKELTILGSKSCEGFIRRLIEMGYPGLQSRLAFKLRFQEISEQAEVRFRTLRIRAARTEHSILNHTLRIDFLKGEALSFAVSGDGRPTPSSLKLISDVAVLLHEAYSVKPSTPIHSSMMELEQMLTNTNIKNIGVSHHSRLELKKLQRRIRVLRRQDPRWFCVIPEMSIPLEGARSTIKF
jgi:ribonuclease BN (tRNA processing enzyme)